MLRTSLKWSLIYLLEAVAVLLALAIFLCGAALWRLSGGPVPLEFLRENVQTQLAAAFEGDVVALGVLEARYDPGTQSLVFLARDVTVAEASGEVVARAPLIEAGLAVDELLFGRISPVSLTVNGGSLSIVRRADGAVGAGLGSVDRVAAQARLPQRGGDDSASLFELLRDPAGSNGILGRLQRMNIENAAVRIVDEMTGIAWLIDDAGVLLDRDASRIRSRVSGRLATPSGFAPISIDLEAGAALNTLLLEARLDNLHPSALAPGEGPASVLGGIDAPVSLNVVVNAFRQTGIRTASIDLEFGEGILNFAGQQHPLENAVLRVGFDPIEGELTIVEGRIESGLATLALDGRVFDIGSYVGALPTRWQYELNVGAGRVDLGGVFERPPVWDGLHIQGHTRLQDRFTQIEALDVRLPGLTAQLTGQASLSQVEDGSWLPNLRLDGPVSGDITPGLVLSYWPVDLAEGARDWIDGGILGGDFFNAQFHLDLDAGSIQAGSLANERLNLSFDFENAAVRYISTMTPLLDGRGSAVLRGNAFEVAMESGRIGDIEVYDAFVDMPRLNPKGALARYGGRARGSAADILALIDEPPLEIPTDYGLNPQAIGGEGEVEFEFHRPMLSEVDPDDIPFDVSGRFTGVSIGVPDSDIELTAGEVALSANQERVEASGTAMFVDTPVELHWLEDLQMPDGETSTTFEVSAQLGARALDTFGIPARRFLDGQIAVEARARSNGLDIRSIDIDADLTEADIEAPAAVWVKPAGEPGSAGFTMGTNEAGHYVLEEFVATAEGLDIAARAELTRDGRLVQADIDRLLIEGLVDVSGEVSTPQGGEAAFNAQLTGRYLDAREIIPHLLSFDGSDNDVPLSLRVAIGRLIVSEQSVLDDFQLHWHGEEAGVRAFLMSGNTVDGPFNAEFGAPEEGAEREFRVQAQSLGRLAALFGLGDNIIGGRLSMLGEAPPLGVDGPLTARAEIRDVTLVDMPILARILAAGSFEGLGALLSGEGISFDMIDSDMMIEEGLLTIGEARAAGSALGVTAAGTIDFTNSVAAIDGNLAPSYVLNSLLGDVPLIGGLLVSRPGEGVIGITYSVEGPFDGLRVFANPLSALAPGVLRRMFEGTAAERAARDRSEQPGGQGGEAQDGPDPDSEQGGEQAEPRDETTPDQ